MNIRARKRKGKRNNTIIDKSKVLCYDTDARLIGTASSLTASSTREKIPTYMFGSPHIESIPGRKSISGIIKFDKIITGTESSTIRVRFKETLILGIELLHEGDKIPWSDIIPGQEYTFHATSVMRGDN